MHVGGYPHLLRRDVYDHSVQIIDLLETFRELATGLTETYMSGLSIRMNEIMKVLTIMGTIFIPLTFLAGVYGMNMKMPEYEWSGSYPISGSFHLDGRRHAGVVQATRLGVGGNDSDCRIPLAADRFGLGNQLDDAILVFWNAGSGERRQRRLSSGGATKVVAITIIVIA